MSGRALAVLLLCTGALAAVIIWNPLATFMVGACTVALLVGFRWKRGLPTLAGGWLLYPPLAVALTKFIPAFWSYLASGLFIIVVSERLIFEYEVSLVLESPVGVDAEARSLVSELSKAHAKKMSAYVALAVAVMAASAAVSDTTHYASELIAATLFLIIIIAIYVTR
jgi:hypothetical protein